MHDCPIVQRYDAAVARTLHEYVSSLGDSVQATPWVLSMVAALNFGSNLLRPAAGSSPRPEPDVRVDTDIDLAVFAPHLAGSAARESFLARLVDYVGAKGVEVVTAGPYVDAAKPYSLPSRCARVGNRSTGVYRCVYRTSPWPLSVNLVTRQLGGSLGDIYSLILRLAGAPPTYVDVFFYSFRLASSAYVHWEGRRWPFPSDASHFLEHLRLYTNRALGDERLQGFPDAVRGCLAPPLRSGMSLCNVACELNASAACAAMLSERGAVHVRGLVPRCRL
mmetsp:Transcript_27238/g.79779  ORF Transcript_27238/g.79779 Transcript_27238/m.79779 type:complete len:278 (-) Transcript_27238:18-851(-)